MPMFRILATATAAGLLAGCALGGGEKPTAPLTLLDSPASRAAEFTALQNGKTMNQVQRVAIAACNVLFSTKTGASATTSAGLFGEVGVNRTEAKVQHIYKLAGATDAQLQGITDRICADAPAQLKAAGFEVIAPEVVAADPEWANLQTAGKAAPYEWNPPGPNLYKLFAAKGTKVYEDRYLGAGATIGNIFAQAKGNSPVIIESRLVQSLNATVVRINILVDFASATSNQQKGFLASLAGQDTAEVKTGVRLSISGDVSFLAPDNYKCWERFGKQECMLKGMAPRVATKKPVIGEGQFYSEIKDTESTGMKVAEGFATALGMLAGTSTLSNSEETVFVKMPEYADLSAGYASRFIGMAAHTANAAR